MGKRLRKLSNDLSINSMAVRTAGSGLFLRMAFCKHDFRTGTYGVLIYSSFETLFVDK